MGKTKGKLATAIICLLESLPQETNYRIHHIHSDDGKEFTEIFNYAESKHIRTSTSVPYIPEENPIAERTIRIVNAKVFIMLKQGGIP